MTLLRERFPALATMPQVSLVDAPTPVARLARMGEETGADLWVKRDDQTASRYGGNKTRKLEWLLADAKAREADVLVTAGAWGSHHVLATTLHGTRAGFTVEAMVAPQPVTPHVVDDVRAGLRAGVLFHRVPFGAALPAALHARVAALRAKGQRPYLIPLGGSSPVGALGYVEAGLELAVQVDAGELPEPASVHMALGTGGTVAGLAVGLAAAGLTTQLVGVRVTPRVVAPRSRLSRLVHDIVALLQEREPRFPSVARSALARIVIDHRAYGDGYGVPSREVERAMLAASRDGLALDVTYTGRAMMSFLRDASSKRYGTQGLFLHTLSSAPMAPLLDGAPAPPAWLSRSV